MSRSDRPVAFRIQRRYRGDPRRDFLEPLGRTMATQPFLQLLGPVPLLVIVRGVRVRHIGWRGLVMKGAVPFALVDCCKGRDGRRFFSLHGPDSAASFLRYLLTLRQRRVAPRSLCVVQTNRPRHACLLGDGRHAVPLTQIGGQNPRHRPWPVSFAQWHRKVLRQGGSRRLSVPPTIKRS
jgi:hypothetical protein